MFNFYFEHHEPFGSLKKNCPELDKDKSIVSKFPKSVVYRSAVQVVFKRATVRFVTPDILIKSTKIEFPEMETKFLQRFRAVFLLRLVFCQSVYVRHLEVSWVKLTRFVFVYLRFKTPLPD